VQGSARNIREYQGRVRKIREEQGRARKSREVFYFIHCFHPVIAILD